jgi:hypothetical protein
MQEITGGVGGWIMHWPYTPASDSRHPLSQFVTLLTDASKAIAEWFLECDGSFVMVSGCWGIKDGVWVPEPGELETLASLCAQYEKLGLPAVPCLHKPFDDKWWPIDGPGSLNDPDNYAEAIEDTADRIDTFVGSQNPARPMLIYQADVPPVSSMNTFWSDVLTNCTEYKHGVHTLWSGSIGTQVPYGFSRIVPYTPFAHSVIKDLCREGRARCFDVSHTTAYSSAEDNLLNDVKDYLREVAKNHSYSIPVSIGLDKWRFHRHYGNQSYSPVITGFSEEFWYDLLQELQPEMAMVVLNELKEGEALVPMIGGPDYGELIRTVARMTVPPKRVQESAGPMILSMTKR